MAALSELLAESFGLSEVYVAHWKVVSGGQFGGQSPRQFSNEAFPLTLRRLVLGRPKTFR